jgi:ankyrin repeat protein
MPIFNAAMPDGRTALMFAAESGAGEAVNALIAAGAAVNAVRSDGQTALMRAATKNFPGICWALLQAHADVNARGPHQATALMFAAVAGNAEAVYTLIQGGADVNAKTDQDPPLTAVDLARAEGYDSVARAIEVSGGHSALTK